MKQIKIFAAAVMFCTATFAGYTAYEKATMTDAERMIMANVDALTDPPEDGGYRYSDRAGDADYCTLSVYVNIETGASINIDGESSELEASGKYVKKTIQGLEDNCPRKGDGCNPYSCQEVPY